MSSNLPKIPPIQYSPDQRNLALSLDALIKNINSILGTVAKLDSNVTEVSRTIVSVSDSQNITYPEPEALTALTATGLFQSVVLNWSAGVIAGFAYFEIHRADTDNLANAVLVGTALTTLFYDTVEEGQTYYYWVRTVNQNNVAGPFNGTAGASASTAISATTLLDELAGKIQASQLHSNLSDRIDLVDATGGLVDQIGVIQDDLYTPSTGIAATLIQVRNAVYDAVTGLATRASASDVDALSTMVSHPDSGLAARALQIDLTNLSSTVDGKADATRVSSLETAVNDPTNGLSSKASQSSVTALSSTVDGKASASSVNALSTTVNGHTSTIQQQATTINGLSAEFTIKTDVNGRIVGYGIYNDADTAAFEILAPVFTVWDPDLNQYVIGTSGGNTFIQGAYIANASIESASIKEVLAEQIVSGSLLSGTWIKGGDYFGGQLRLGVGGVERLNENGQLAGYSLVVDANGDLFSSGSIDVRGADSSFYVGDGINNFMQFANNKLTVGVDSKIQGIPSWAGNKYWDYGEWGSEKFEFTYSTSNTSDYLIERPADTKDGASISITVYGTVYNSFYQWTSSYSCLSDLKDIWKIGVRWRYKTKFFFQTGSTPPASNTDHATARYFVGVGYQSTLIYGHSRDRFAGIKFEWNASGLRARRTVNNGTSISLGTPTANLPSTGWYEIQILREDDASLQIRLLNANTQEVLIDEVYTGVQPAPGGQNLQLNTIGWSQISVSHTWRLFDYLFIEY